MEFGETLVALFGIMGVFGIPISLIWTSHRRKILELQLRLKQESEAGVKVSVEALREEMRSLRDTTMQYDISFDNALQRMEQRVENLERNAQAARTDEIAQLRAGR